MRKRAFGFCMMPTGIHRFIAFTLAILLTLSLICTPIQADEVRNEVYVTAKMPQKVTVKPSSEIEPTYDDIFNAPNPFEAEIDRDYEQEIDVPLHNATSATVEYYLEVSPESAAHYPDLSMGFVAEGGSQENTAFLQPHEDGNAVLMVFAQEAENSLYGDISLLAHVLDKDTREVKKTYSQTLHLTVLGEELNLDYETQDIGNGNIEITLTNQGASVKSLKVEAESSFEDYVFFPMAITNYELDENASVAFTISPTDFSGSKSGSILAIGNGGRIEIPVTLQGNSQTISGSELSLIGNELRDIEPEENSLKINEDSSVSYSFQYDNGQKEIPVSLRMTVEGTNQNISDSPDGEGGGRVSGIEITDTALVGARMTLRFTHAMTTAQFLSLANSGNLASLMDTQWDAVNNVLVHYELDIDLSNFPNAEEFSDEFNEAAGHSHRLNYVSNLPKLPAKLRDNYTAALQMEFLLRLLESDSTGKYQEFQNKLAEEINKQYNPPVDNPIEVLKDSVEELRNSLEERIADKYPEFADAIKEDKSGESKKVIDIIKKDEDESKDEVVVITDENGHQCTNRGLIESRFYVRNVQQAQTSSLLDGDFSDSPVRVFYTGRIVSEDKYVSFEPITYKLILNGHDAGTSSNSGLSEMHIVELNPAFLNIGGMNTFVRDYDVYPGHYFVNTNNRFTIVYTGNPTLQANSLEQVQSATPDFDIYAKNVFAVTDEGEYISAPIAGNNTLRVSLSNRGAHGGFYTLSVKRDGVELLSPDEAAKYRYLEPFAQETLNLEGIALNEGNNPITVLITDVSNRTKDTNADNNAATVNIEARERKEPVIQSVTPSDGSTVSSYSSGVSMRAVVSNAYDIRNVAFYLNGELAGSTKEITDNSKWIKNVENSEYEYAITGPSLLIGTVYELRVEVSYYTGSAGSNRIDKVSRTVTFRTPSLYSKWADIVLPDGVQNPQIKLLRDNGASYSVYGENENITIESFAGNTQVGVKAGASAEDAVLLLYDAEHSMLYSGKVGERGDNVTLTADKTLTVESASVLSLTVAIPGTGESYQVLPQANGQRIQLPALLMNIGGRFRMSDESEQYVSFDSIDLRTIPGTVFRFNNQAAILSAETAEVARLMDADGQGALRISWTPVYGDIAYLNIMSANGASAERFSYHIGDKLDLDAGSYTVQTTISDSTGKSNAAYKFLTTGITVNAGQETSVNILSTLSGDMRFDGYSGETVELSESGYVTARLLNLKDSNGNLLTYHHQSEQLTGRVKFTPSQGGNSKEISISVNSLSQASGENTYLSSAISFVAPSAGEYDVSFYTDVSMFVITATAGAGGAISPAGSTNVRPGSDCSFSITANNGYAISDVQVDGASVGIRSTYTFSDVNASHTIATLFTPVYTGGGSSGGGSGSSSSSRRPSVSIVNPEGGKVTAGTTSVTIKPNAGYRIASVTVNGVETSVAENGVLRNLSYKDNVRVTFAKTETSNPMEDIPSKQEPEPIKTPHFTDVPPESYYFTPVEWAVSQGITNGRTATTFEPATVCTRAHAVTFLWRAAGSPVPVSVTNPFQDVSADKYYYYAVLWALERGITNGTSTTTFEPDIACSRAQIVTFLCRYVGNPRAGTAPNPFFDVISGNYYYNAVLWASQTGVTQGTSATTFEPNLDCTRGQIVTFLYRHFTKM